MSTCTSVMELNSKTTIWYTWYTDFNKRLRLVGSLRNFRVLGPTNMAAAIFRWIQFLKNRSSIKYYFEISVCKLD